jgi:hypothetical protein
MANELEFPKVDGDVYYATESNYNMGGYWSDVKTYTLAVTNASAALDLSAVSDKLEIIIQNTGSADAYFNLGATATTSSFLLRVGESITLVNSSFNTISAITAASTTNLTIIVKTLTGKTAGNTNFEILNLAVTTASADVSFTDTTSYKSILISNIGVADCYFAFGAAATTANGLLESNKNVLIQNTNKSQISAITASGTTTLRILGVY